MIRAEWEKALADQQSRLQKKRYAGLLQSLDYESFQTTIAEADQRYRERNIARHIESLSPVLKHLQAFVQAFTTLLAARPETAGLVWGGILVVLVVSYYLATMSLCNGLIGLSW